MQPHFYTNKEFTKQTARARKTYISNSLVQVFFFENKCVHRRKHIFKPATHQTQHFWQLLRVFHIHLRLTPQPLHHTTQTNAQTTHLHDSTQVHSRCAHTHQKFTNTNSQIYKNKLKASQNVPNIKGIFYLHESNIFLKLQREDAITLLHK